MLVVDSQVHIWAANTPERPWPAGRHAAQRDIPLGAEALLVEMDEAGVDATLIIPPSWEGERNDLAIAAAKAHPKRFAAMGLLNPNAPDAEAQLATWKSQPGMLGLRYSLHRPGLAESLDNGSMDKIWAGAQEHGIPIMLLLPQTKMAFVDRVADRYPGLNLIIDHMGVPSSVPADQRFANLQALLDLARHPTIAVKASALPCFALDAYPYRSLHGHVRRTLDAFGPKRVFWGSDLSRLPCTYRQAVTLFTEEMHDLTADEKAWIMGRGICEWLGWNLPESQ
jgi:predicted TIM-barrel fold metal-dependent hydrolase